MSVKLFPPHPKFPFQVGIEAGVLVNAAGQHKPSYGARYYTSSAGSGRTVDLLPYRRFYATLVLQEVFTLGVLTVISTWAEKP